MWLSHHTRAGDFGHPPSARYTRVRARELASSNLWVNGLMTMPIIDSGTGGNSTLRI